MNHVDFTTETQNIISLCTGIRGLERGLERAGLKIRTVAFVEIEAFICENLASEMEQGLLDEAPIWTNLKTFDGRKFRGLVHGITGGYPCQPFSVAGKRNGKEDPRHLWPYIGGGTNSIINAIRPLWCFFENVPGHLTLGYREVREDLQRLGYAVKEGIFSAEETGASHRRERLFILAIRKDYLEYYYSQRWSDVQKKTEQYGANKKRHLEISGEERKDIECGITQSSSNELGNPSELHAQRCNPRPWQIQSWRTGDEPENQLANTEYIGFNGTKDREGVGERDQRNKKRKDATIKPSGCGSKPSGCDEELANCHCARPQIWQEQPAWEELKAIERSDRTVARPGEQQHEWESPRTTKHQWETQSCVGGRIDGYAFREDFLRALGNSVYEASAELAFRTLMKKHGTDL